jgi:hypothetical protein
MAVVAAAAAQVARNHAPMCAFHVLTLQTATVLVYFLSSVLVGFVFR